MTTAVPNITLNNGVEIPQLGFGVFQIEPEKTKDATLAAIEVGYRHIDTAEMYGNEKEVGDAVRASGLDRGNVYITSKLNNGFHEPDDARRAFDGTLTALGSDYVDLFLIHWPLPTLYDGRTNHAKAVLDNISEAYDLDVLSPPIPKSIRFAEAPAAGRSILRTSRGHRGADAYREVAKALTSRAARS